MNLCRLISRIALRVAVPITLLLSLLSQTVVAQTMTKIRLVQGHASVGIGEEVFLYAVPKALGYFREEGLDVEMSGAANSIAAGQLLEVGRAEFASMLAESVLAMREQGATPIAFWTLKQNNGYAVGLLPSSPIRSLADLTGKTIGFVTVGAGSSKILAETLRQAGVEPSFREVSVGAGPQIVTALRNKSVDAVLLWDAVYGRLESQGLKLDQLELPIQDHLAGFAMTTTERFVANNPTTVAKFCRAISKGLYFTRINPRAAIQIFYREFPTAKPADQDEAAAVAVGTNILNTWLRYAEKGIDLEGKSGWLDPARWDFSEATYRRLGLLGGLAKGSAAMTNRFFDSCNDFNRASVAAQARTMGGK